MFGNRRHFRELLKRLRGGHRLEHPRRPPEPARRRAGLLTRPSDPRHKQKAVYSLTEKAIELVPVLVQMGAWGRRHLPVSEELVIRAALLEEGGPRLWDDFMDDLREAHLGRGAPPPRPRGPSVSERLRAAYEAAVAEGRGARRPGKPDLLAARASAVKFAKFPAPIRLPDFSLVRAEDRSARRQR